ncbi:3-deoxy-manno-octulosonate cytidylyltransferase [Paludibaculum fermentans]|uniref:3-deoxy-manno-octulosonate cytidylyltransferase n=1 Tax=Paludibaculum fermentans TaxID=1473598 RepID=UPI003EB7808F
MPPKILGVIPARFASVRFPGKPIATLAGKPMIQHVWERTRLAKLPQRTLIATDDERIADTARGFGAEVVITRHDHISGTDRVAEAAATTDAEIIVNIQGDEPLIDPDAIDAAITVLLDDPECQMATLKKRIVERDEIENPNVVKVVTGHDGRALYFSRHPIPYNRGGSAEYWKHIGLYVYRRALLLGYSTLRLGVLEENEKLEQLRALENGISIRVAETRYETIGVDTPEDLLHVESLLFTASIPTTNHG